MMRSKFLEEEGTKKEINSKYTLSKKVFSTMLSIAEKNFIGVEVIFSLFYLFLKQQSRNHKPLLAL